MTFGSLQADPLSFSCMCNSTAGSITQCLLKAKFHYTSWFGAGSKLVRSWNLAYHLAC